MGYATWCPHCNKMKKDVFTDPAVIAFMEKNFICAALDIDKPEGAKLKNKFGMHSYPAFVFLDENETLLYNVTGELKAADILNEAKNALDPKKQLPYLKSEFEKDLSNANKCLDYLMAIRKGQDRKSISAPAHQYLATQSEKQLISTINWRIIANAVTDINSREFQYVLKHQDEFAKITSPLRVERKIVSIASELLTPYTNSLDTINYKKQREIAKSINLQKIDSLVFANDLLIYERSKSWKSYQKTTIESVEKQAWNDSKMLKEIAQIYSSNISDKIALEHAILWVKRALEIKDTYDGNIILSRLYLKISDKKQAEVYARKASEIAKSLGWNSKDADDLFRELDIK